MTRTPYQKEANHERRLKQKWEGMEYQVMRSAGSKGLIDLLAWNDHEIVFIASQRVSWHPAKMRAILNELKRPPNSRVLFYAGREEIYEAVAKEMISDWEESPEGQKYPYRTMAEILNSDDAE